jgi:glucose/arabinose dehydrogenase
MPTLRLICLFLFMCCCFDSYHQPTAQAINLPIVEAELVATGFHQPTAVTHAGDGRLFIAERAGLVQIILPNGLRLPYPLLDIRHRVLDDSPERGLLGLAFHPDYPQEPYLYVSYSSEPQTDTEYGSLVIARFTINDLTNLSNPASYTPILIIPHLEGLHYGGDLKFGPDGYLYIGVGDGTGLNSHTNTAQDGTLLLGKLLRIDIRGTAPYTIPPDNPFVQQPEIRPEIWAMGLRNPWRFSFDRLTDDLFIGDVGQYHWEEINIIPSESASGQNFGWRCWEGPVQFEPAACTPDLLHTPPKLSHPHHHSDENNQAFAIVTGFRYRGQGAPALYGYLLYMDFVSGRLWLARPTETQIWQSTPMGTLPGVQSVSTIGEDCAGELLIADFTDGELYRIQASAAPTAVPLTTGPHTLYLPIIQTPSLTLCRPSS